VKITETKEGSILEVFVKPKSKEFRVVVEGDEVEVYCKEEPAKGKVNKELVKKFSRLFHKEVSLISGFTSKQKRLLIRNTEKSEVEKVLLTLSSEA
jgi:uncharacterized protein (TIGR00251 family)